MLYKLRLLCLIAILAVIVVTSTSGTAGAASTKDTDSEIIALFQENRFEEIIQTAANAQRLNAWENLLLAKSYERLGYYHRSNRVLKVLFNQNPDYRYFIPYFIAKNYEELKDYSNALKWYGLIVNSRIQSSETVKFMFLINAFERVVAIREDDPRLMPQCVKVLEKSLKHYPEASYYLGLLYDEHGDRQMAAAFYYEMLNNEREVNKKKTLERVIKDDVLIRSLNELGLRNTRLAEMLKEREFYEGAIYVSYLLPENARTLELRAYCNYKKRDYSAALGIYQSYYNKYKDPEALKQISLCYYMTGRHNQSYEYLKKYLLVMTGREDPGIDVMYLQHELERSRLNIKEYIEQAESSIEKYGFHEKVDRIIQNTFYRAIEVNEEDLGVKFLKKNYKSIKGTSFQAWALYILGIYKDEDYLHSMVDELPGSYYYFSAAPLIEVKPSLLRDADRYYNQGRMDKAFDIYIQLYSSGIQIEYVSSRILHIISDEEPYRSFFQLAAMERGRINSPLFDLLRMGLYDELKDIILVSYDSIDREQRMFLNYILSRVYYKTGDVYRGVLHAERMFNGYEVNNLLFLPKEILYLLYPNVYVDIINKTLSESSNNLDPYFILALIREESRYNNRAKSSKGAIGLMQLLPQTANWMANRNLSEEELKDPQENIEIGIKYVSYLHSRFDSLPEILAAYNGGPNNVKKWLARRPDNSTNKFIEEIPFTETRIFVKRVIRSYNMYMEIYGKESSL
ncbi:MAG: lytic transglycosylase domain-containing protein [Spirochaetota bacterium]|nr:MAG: lytic transglycosylase domain-containing protein [Spirochaetota bacterium]